MCFFVFCMSSSVRVGSLDVLDSEKNGLEEKYHRSQDTYLALDNQRSKADFYVCELP